jgi:cell division protein FtsI/penicillin-binding protein 2
MFKFNQEIKQSSEKRRISFFIVLFTILFLVILIKLFNVQILNSSRYQLAAKKQYESRISLKPTRGIIYDRKLNALVTNVNSYSFAADPNMVDNKDLVAELFSKIFEKDKSYYLDRLNTQNTSFVWLERRTDPKYEAKCQNINFSGVIKLNEARRQFNYGTLGTQIIGATDIDNIGLTGVELECNELLQGKDGYVVMQKDGLGKKRQAIEYPRQEPVNGNNVILTIDMNIQKIVEEELERGVAVNDALGGKCIVMSVKTGQILGMYSSVNGNVSNNEKAINYNKLAFLTDLYEPGSTYKIVTASASLEEGLESKYDIIQTHGGEYMFSGITVKDSHKSSSMTFQQVIEQSSNIGTMMVATKLGPERFYKYARDFGFGISTGIDLPGEMKGSLKRPIEFTPVSLKFMAIGYEVLVTALQMANAYSCIANDGVLMRPYVIRKETAPDGSIIKETGPTQVRTVVSKRTARTLTDLFCGVVEKGTGVEARVEDVKIAGKTGTAQKLVDGEYSKRYYTSSFIGYFPADNPQIVIAVIIDAPKAGEIYGGKVSAPIFKCIAEKIIAITGTLDYSHPSLEEEGAGNIKLANNTGDNNSEKNNSINLIGLDINDAVKLLKEKNIDYEVEGYRKNATVIDQKEIAEDAGYNYNIKITLVTRSNTAVNKGVNDKENIVMPDFKGLGLRKCVKIISDLGLDFIINGNGKVISQKPEAGASLQKVKQIVLNCECIN